MNEVYVIAGGEWLRNNLNAIAAFMGTRTWDSIEKIALTLSVLAVAVMWVQRHNVMDLLGWVAVFVLISLLVNVRTSVQIIDNSDLVQVHRVDNVPVGLAMPLSLTTRIGHAMVAGYEMVFAQPDSATYSKTGMLFGAGLIVKSTDFLSRNPEIINLFQDYVQNCVLGDIYLNHKYTLEDLMVADDPYMVIFSRPSPLRGVYDSNNNFVSCKDASVTLKDKLNLDTKSGGKTWHYYVQQLFGGRPDPDLLFRELLSDSYSYFYGASQSASQIMRKNVTINALKEGITSNAARNGDTASLVSLATTSSMEKQRLAHVSVGHVIMRNLPMVQTILTGITIGIFPLLVLAAAFNKMTLPVLKGYVFALMWLQTWPLLYAILNSAMTFYAKQNGAPVVLSEVSQIQLKYSDLASTAGYLSAMIPPASADVNSDMNQFFNKLGFATNTTQAGVWQGQAAGYAYGGSLYARNQVRNIQLISMTLPDINAGCGGIDAYLGSFSFINGEQLQRFVKQIMSNAMGYFFDLALQTTVPEIKTAKDFLQKMANDINSMNLSSCQVAQGIVGGLFPQTQVSQQKVCQDIAGESNIFADWAASRQGCTVGGQSSSVRDKASDKDKERVLKNINIIWDSLSKNRMLDGNKELKEFIMTLTGTLIFGEDSEITPLPARTTDRDILRAIMEGGTAKIYHCNDSDKCLKVVADANVTIARDKALKSQITKLLTSIQNKAVSDTPLDDREKGFISSTTVPVFKYLIDPQMLGVSSSVVYQLTDYIGYDIMLQYIQELLQQARAMIATGNYPQTVLDSVLENLNQAQQQIAVFQGQVKVQQDALLVVDRQMSYMRQQLSARMLSRYQNNYHFGGSTL
ncbi:conjugal transfer mating pair stabilization protein TraG [Escherichia coli]|nr:conjugal transfer mating pair stabilization protein TraG [Escherichia coli]